MGRQFLVRNEIQMWTKPLTNDRTAFVFMLPSATGTPTNVTVALNELSLNRFPSYIFYETFTGQLIGVYKSNESFSHAVNPSGSVFTFWAQPAKFDNGKLIQPLQYMSLRPHSQRKRFKELN